MATRTCILCGGQPVTKEHVLPDWLRREIGPVPNIESQWRRVGSPDESTRSFETRGVEWAIRALCEECNGWSARTFEDPVVEILRPMVRGEKVWLSSAHRTTLAGWTAKTAIMADQLINGNNSKLPQADRLRLRQTGSPPYNTRVWLGHHAAAPGAASFFWHQGIPIVDTATGEQGGHGYCTTFVFLAVVVQVVWHNLLPGSVVNDGDVGFEPFAELVWPTAEGGVWPSRPPLPSYFVSRFSRRFAPGIGGGPPPR